MIEDVLLWVIILSFFLKVIIQIIIENPRITVFGFFKYITLNSYRFLLPIKTTNKSVKYVTNLCLLLFYICFIIQSVIIIYGHRSRFT